ncbi:MAG TPA: glycosyltransferase, partial [Gemmatimonadales bacterium]|nr:glycosyltransferase [Gemmatimonadales bacterium]
MRIVMFYHSLVSDWNHGNAHFLRGIVTELQSRGHEVRVYEPASAWSRENLLQQQGQQAITEFSQAYPNLTSELYQVDNLDLDQLLDGADLVLVHEWNEHGLVENIGRHRASGGRYQLLFHDTHHRSVSAQADMAGYRLENYDGVLAFGEVIRERYLKAGWASRVWTWHEAADVRVFYPRDRRSVDGDVVWVGNWGDDERTQELEEFLIRPVEALGAAARVHGVRYPDQALGRLAKAAMEYAGWIPNYRVPEIFARFKLTLHIPRRPYVEALPGIPTIRVFEALACGIPLVCAPWEDAENLFSPGDDYLVARTGAEMREHIASVLADPAAAAAMARRGLDTILARHTCAHRVDQLLDILEQLH